MGKIENLFVLGERYFSKNIYFKDSDNNNLTLRNNDILKEESQNWKQ